MYKNSLRGYVTKGYRDVTGYLTDDVWEMRESYAGKQTCKNDKTNAERSVDRFNE